MATVKIDWDEWYPVYFVVGEKSSYYQGEYEISEEDLALVRRAADVFYEAQEILRKIVHPEGR